MAFKQATVNASLVPSTQTNFPSFLDPSRAGASTLAEVQSARIYADSGKVVEWAREVVSATEMHVKVPSLTSTVSVFVDYDGIRADYAVTDTYGRNAVWSDYLVVQHLESAAMTDSTGGTTPTANGTIGNISPTLIQGGAVFGTDQSDFIEYGTSLGASLAGQYTLSMYYKPTAEHAFVQMLFSNWSAAQRNFFIFRNNPDDKLYMYSGNGDATQDTELISTSTLPLNTGRLIHFTRNGTSKKIFQNGAADGSQTSTKTGGTNTANTRVSRYISDAALSGEVDEIRMRTTEVSANWIATEYNNQNDEPTFWGSWSDVGGPVNQSAFFPLLQML